jgi:hypothetical protein
VIALWATLALAVPDGAWAIEAQFKGRRERSLADPVCAWERTTLRWTAATTLVVRQDRLCADRAGWVARWSEVEVPIAWVDAQRYLIPHEGTGAIDVSVLRTVTNGAVRGHASRTWRVTAEVLTEGGLLEPEGERMRLHTDSKSGLILVAAPIEPDWVAVRARVLSD